MASPAAHALSTRSQKLTITEKPAPIDIAVLQSASTVLHEQFTKDAQIIPDLGDTLTGQASSSYSISPDDTRVPFQKRKLVGIPEGLFQYYSSTSVNSHMGLIPELERAWISIDHKLFLWDYNEGQEISSFVDQPYVITHVSVVKPKKGLFIEEISHLLVICTPMSVLLIALSLSPASGSGARSRKEVQLYATDLTISTEVEMTSVIGTPEGRIFMCGAQDGNLYELHYQENESWFGKRIQLINHSVGGMSSLLPRFASSSVEDRIISVVSDQARHCFYTLTEKNVISIYKPTSDKSVQHVQTLSNLYKAVQDKCPGAPAINPQAFQIISLHPISPLESRNGVQLLALTTNGVRLYFSPSTFSSYSYSMASTQGPGTRSLQLVHVRLPPSNLIHPDEQEKPYRPPANAYATPQNHPPHQARSFVVSEVDSSCYIGGLTLAAQHGDTEGSDYILCMSPDLTRIGSLDQLNLTQSQPPQPTYSQYGSHGGTGRPQLTEYATLLSIPGRTWAMAAVPPSSASNGPPPDFPSPVVTNELATQFTEPTQQFMILTNVGLTFLVKRRAVDYLRAVMEELQSEGNIQPIIEFRDSFGRNQTCAMLLGVACGNTFLDADPSAGISTVGQDIASVAKQAFYDFGERPIWSERMVYGKSENQGTAIYSGRREGLALYFARLVRPIYKSKLTSPRPSGTPQAAISDTTLVAVQKNLVALKDLLDRNPHLFHSNPGDSASSRPPTMEQDAWKAEQSSVFALLSLLTRIIEGLSFVLLLYDYHFGELISKCDNETQKIVSSLTFEDLVTTQNGLNASRALVNVIIDQQIGQQISVDTISEVLQNRCGSFCSTDDVMLYKAKENIRKAAETSNPTERQKWSAESLRLYTKGARILDLEKLREIIGDFQLLKYAQGAVELPLTCAKVFDQDNVGFDYWQAGSTVDDQRRAAFERRLHCYELVLDSLSVFEQTENSPELEAVKTQAYNLSFASDDPMFHSTLYEWLIGRQLADDLLEIRPHFLESHLQKEPITVENYQLLWQFYVKDGRPLEAARILSVLAESDTFNLDLSARLEYLTLAVGNAKSHPVSAGGRIESAIAFLTDLEEKLEVAQVQLEAYHALIPHVNDSPEVGERIQRLSKKLFTMSELYQEYAVPFDMPQLKLLCLHVSEHRDEPMLRQIWNQIFDSITEFSSDTLAQADKAVSTIVPLGQRFYPSEFAFPLALVSDLLIRFSLERKENLPSGWAPRILRQCKVPFVEIWHILHDIYDSHLPPFNSQTNVQSLSSDIAILLSDWMEEAKRPSFTAGRDIPVTRLDAAVEQYLAESNSGETKAIYENVKRQLRRNW
ncbi:nucleoporin [Marasmius fiardii PR-910]|nr:nucleoporin [Marasmius fiardii PR-910]